MAKEIGMLIQPVARICLAEYIQTSEYKTSNAILCLADEKIFNFVFSLAVIRPGDNISKRHCWYNKSVLDLEIADLAWCKENIIFLLHTSILLMNYVVCKENLRSYAVNQNIDLPRKTNNI